MVLDIVLFPHCDIHVALNGPPLQIRVMERRYRQDSSLPGGEDTTKFQLRDVTEFCRYDFLAPFENVGSRIRPFVNISSTGIVTPQAVGINLVNITFQDADEYHHTIVTRIQVHQQILGWWFGNQSITSAKDTFCAHSQVSIYALFSDDAYGTDLVGDITGHGFVDLVSNNPSLFHLDSDKRGRIWGDAEGIGTLKGTFLGSTKTLNVKIVDYAKRRNILEAVQFVKDVDEAHNILLIPEGFRDTDEDKARFDQIVTKIVDDLFHKPRHEPYGLLQGSFNVFKAYVPSEQHTLTCGHKINDQSISGVLEDGNAIPYRFPVKSGLSKPYSPEELIKIVGLPKRNETRSTADLKALWSSQSLTNYDNARVDDNLANVYKIEKSDGILEARDTFFGMHLGGRYGDRQSIRVGLVPATDDPTDVNLPFFIERMYDWYHNIPTRDIDMDIRRHPPELYKMNMENASTSFMQFVKNLYYKYEPHQQIGLQWVPDPNIPVLQKSRGLIAVICNEAIYSGTSFNSGTITAVGINSLSLFGFIYQNTSTEKVMKRNPPDQLPLDIHIPVDTLAHEFGHSFHLGDEYEDFIEDKWEDIDSADNITSLYSIRLNDDFKTNRLIDMDLVKWFDMLRIKLSSVLIEDSVEDAGRLKVKIDKEYIGKWSEAKAQNQKVFVRKLNISRTGVQLPLNLTSLHFVQNLDILEVDESSGFVILGGSELPALPLPVYTKGSTLFIPQRDEDNKEVLRVVERKVLNFLKNDPAGKNKALNKDTNISKLNSEVDDPKDIPDFKPPCKSYKLIGIYEGAAQYTGGQFRPAGGCKMRADSGHGGAGEFCFVCKYLIVNRVNPGLHDLLNLKYYPEAKKNWDSQFKH